MIKKTIKNYFVILLVLFFIWNCFCSISFATESSEAGSSGAGSSKWESTISDLENRGDKTTASDKVQGVVSTILVVVRIVSIVVAVVILLVLAMKYMTAAPGEKADIKKSLIVYVIGVIIVSAAIGILGLIEMMSHTIN